MNVLHSAGGICLNILGLLWGVEAQMSISPKSYLQQEFQNAPVKKLYNGIAVWAYRNSFRRHFIENFGSVSITTINFC